METTVRFKSYNTGRLVQGVVNLDVVDANDPLFM